MTNKLIFMLFTAIIFAFSSSALADWQLYDDFSSGSIDTGRWNVDDSSATISVENEQAKFIHQGGTTNDSNYLLFNQTPENIIGIRADVFIESCTGDVRARIAGYSGNVGENHLWSGLQLEPNMERVYASANLEGPPPNYALLEESFYAQYKTPTTVIGVPFNLTMVFSNDKITYEVDSLGKIAYKYETPIAPTGGDFKAIGTRSTNGDGPCTVYFDNVYILRP